MSILEEISSQNNGSLGREQRLKQENGTSSKEAPKKSWLDKARSYLQRAQQAKESNNPTAVDNLNAEVQADTEMIALGQSAGKEIAPPVETEAAVDHLAQLKTELMTIAKAKLEQSLQQNPDLSPAEKKALEQRVADIALYFVTQKEFMMGNGTSQESTPLEKIIGGYESLTKENGEGKRSLQTAIEKHSKVVLRLAFEQHWDNPEQYVSHGFDHTLNVTAYSESIVTQNPEILQAIQDKYKVSAGEAKFLVTTVGWFHDFGYPDVGGRGKAVHALAGADIIYSKELQALHTELIRSENADTQNILYDLRDSILFHSADKVERSFSAKLTTSHGTYLLDGNNFIDVVSTLQSSAMNLPGESREVLEIFVSTEEVKQQLEIQLQAAQNDTEKKTGTPNILPKITVTNQEFQGRSVDLKNKKDGLLGAEYQQVDALTSPLHAVVRLADNIDMRADRFATVQQTAAFQEMYHLLGDARTEYGQTTLYFESKLRSFQTELKAASSPEQAQALTQQTLQEFQANLREVGTRDLTDAQEQAAFLRTVDTISDISQVENIWKMFVAEQVLKKHPDLENSLTQRVRALAVYQNSESLRHFGGCEAIQRVELLGDILKVTVDGEQYAQLNQIMVDEKSLDASGNIHKVSVSVAEYQIWRTEEAYRSITINGKSVTIQVVDTSGKIIK